ncbi:hypothetical protein QR685DRAFT_534771 [Neurospora intermedia]|uniref:Uncharacterized protein n=1 Tax=Neurospora intermedia TaxID=5142 RepID=A0ABR3D2J3_NEUIN
MHNSSRPHGNRPLWVGFKIKWMSVVVFGLPELSSSFRFPRLFSLRVVAVEPSPEFSSKVALEVGILFDHRAQRRQTGLGSLVAV